MTVYAHLLDADTWLRPLVWTLFTLFVVAVGVIWNLIFLLSTPGGRGHAPRRPAPTPERSNPE